jgi:hypothetical protein
VEPTGISGRILGKVPFGKRWRSLEAGGLQAHGVFNIKLNRVMHQVIVAGAAPQAAQVIHGVIGADYVAKMGAEAADKAIILLGFGCEVLGHFLTDALSRVQRARRVGR